MRIVSMLMTIVFAGATALAQQSVPPPPQPAADKPAGPSLEVTMKFIQDKLNEIGTVNFADYFHDSADNSDWVQKMSTTDSKVVANPGACTLSYHFLSYADDKITNDEDFSFSLRDVQSIAVMPDEQQEQIHLVRIGHTTRSVKETPDITAMVIKLPKGVDHPIRFNDQETADRVAKALVHAVELCGGGSKPEPF